MALKRILIGAFVAAALAVAAFAQVITVPQLQSIGQTDLVQVIPNGQPSAQSQYFPAAALSGVEYYSYQIPLTAFAITVPAHTDLLYLNPAGTLATGTLTMEPTPSDGQRLCLQDTQTQTAITVSANTGQSLGGIAAPTALVANTRYCWFYNRPLATWIRFI